MARLPERTGVTVPEVSLNSNVANVVPVPESIEIVSPSESARDLHAKVRRYRENGARAVWVIWPEDRQLDIHQSHQPTRHLGVDDVIEGEEPIPAFRLTVAAIFD